MGFASPATAALLTLRPPFWFDEIQSGDNEANLDAGSGLAIGLGPGAAGSWQSAILDPMPVGRYELKVNVTPTSDEAIRLRTAIDPSEPGNPPLASNETTVTPTDASTVTTVPWTSDGTRPFTVRIEARSERGSARLLVSAIGITRVWPIVAGSPRYYTDSCEPWTDDNAPNGVLRHQA